ncbi:F0F1 ATP synthase subunit B, partial [Patescibacteria group bacterium]|nr:F0F1 ATP synthase subunit B [Patescibacteria group bacterium]
MEIVKQFGLDPVLLVAQIVNFLILLFILKKLLYKPVLELLKKREDTIKE